MAARWLALVFCLVSMAANAAQWSYQESVDKMTGKTASYATVRSDNSLSLSSPYSGRNHGAITVRKHPKYGVDVYVYVEKGQILCRSYDGCSVVIRFDDAKPQRFSAVEPADHSSDTVFISNESKFRVSVIRD